MADSDARYLQPILVSSMQSSEAYSEKWWEQYLITIETQVDEI